MDFRTLHLKNYSHPLEVAVGDSQPLLLLRVFAKWPILVPPQQCS